ncbi:cuticle protein 64-like [Sitophilus oryzae]|uniref:Cuticle protein 64-like n=1 Tax=Sitophilus oryzae TaxID=7048 RepID=A0A6J2YRI4_SITOR|nr:cuticle protein 64-like [Sitophilus oryzae]
MFVKISVLFFAIMSFVSSAPAPGFLGEYHGVPAATSYSSRIDIHGPDYVKTYASAPVITKTVVATPIVKAVVPAVYHEPLVAGYGGYGYGLSHDYGLGYGVGYGYGIGHHY